MKSIRLGIYPETSIATPLYKELLLGGYVVQPLSVLKDTGDLDLIIVDLDFLMGDLGELFLALQSKPVVLVAEKGDAIQYAAEWGVMGVLGKDWAFRDLQLVIDFFVVKNKFFPRRDFVFEKTTEAPVSILLIEDDYLTASLVKDSLAQIGELHHVLNIAEARKMLVEQKCDLIILDLFLPDGNGLDLLKEIKNNPFFELVPVLVLSVNDGLTDKLKAFELGANDYLTKPFHILELIARVRALSRGKQKQEVLLCNLKQMSVLAEIDGLTGLYNHRFFADHLRYRFHLANEQNVPLAILMMDVDDFKQYNDSYGHLAGDQVLKEIGKIISTLVRGEDVPARYGGEEFAALLWNVNEKQALKIAERIRGTVNAKLFPGYGDQDDHLITISIGVVISPAASPTELLTRADEALYRAKQKGKNQVDIWREVVMD